MVGRKQLCNLKIGTKANPGDDPSRQEKLRRPRPPVNFAKKHAWLDPSPSLPSSTPLSAKRGLEMFAGEAGLTAELRRQVLPMRPPMDAFPAGSGRKSLWVRMHDLREWEVFQQLKADILMKLLCYAHFGVPCSSWGRAGVLTGGARHKGLPQGTGELQRERERSKPT